MSVYKFKEQEIFVNSLRLYPKYEFTMYSGTMYINNEQPDSGSFTSASLNVPSGYISLLEKNIDRLSGSNNFIYPFITKDGSLQSFATVSTTPICTIICIWRSDHRILSHVFIFVQKLLFCICTSSTFRRSAEHNESLR